MSGRQGTLQWVQMLVTQKKHRSKCMLKLSTWRDSHHDKAFPDTRQKWSGRYDKSGTFVSLLAKYTRGFVEIRVSHVHTHNLGYDQEF